MEGVSRFTNLAAGGQVHVEVQNGRVLHIIPLQIDESDGLSWKIETRGRTFTPPRRTTLSPFTVAHKSVIYSPKRILTPVKRVDFDPDGERNIHKRGESGYESICWDEGLDIVANGIMRLHRRQGPAAMLTCLGSHHLGTRPIKQPLSPTHPLTWGLSSSRGFRRAKQTSDSIATKTRRQEGIYDDNRVSRSKTDRAIQRVHKPGS